MKRPILFTLTLLVGSWLIAAPGAQVQPQPTFQSPVPPIVGYPSSGINGSGTVTSAQILAPDGSASAPSYSFANSTNTGWYLSSVGNLSASASGGERLKVTSTGLQMDAASIVGWGSSGTGSVDVSLSRGAANRLDLATGDSLNLVGGGGAAMINAVPVISSTAPTVTSAGTSPSVSGTNTAAFRVNVGTGGTASAIVLAMPAATTGWNCFAENITATLANRANQRVVLISSTTTAVTVENQTISTGAVLAFTASDIVAFMCLAY